MGWGGNSHRDFVGVAELVSKSVWYAVLQFLACEK